MFQICVGNFLFVKEEEEKEEAEKEWLLNLFCFCIMEGGGGGWVGAEFFLERESLCWWCKIASADRRGGGFFTFVVDIGAAVTVYWEFFP